MTADPFASSASVPLAGTRTWSIAISASFPRLGSTHFHADLFHFDEWACRISLTQPVRDRAQAERILSERCRNWIAREEQRPRRGDTDFQVLN